VAAISRNGYDVITVSRIVLFGRNSAGRYRRICMPRMDMHIKMPKLAPIMPIKQQILMKNKITFKELGVRPMPYLSSFLKYLTCNLMTLN